jgi:hypothetical protein
MAPRGADLSTMSRFQTSIGAPEDWRIPSGGSESDVLFRDSQRKLIEEAHAEYLDHLANAWKGNR